MKFYFKLLVAVFFTVLCYALLTYFFGEKGFYAQKTLQEQVEKIKLHIATLKENELRLSNEVLNLSYDYDTISIYAHQLGYINEGENAIKLVQIQNKGKVAYAAGQYLVLSPITFVSDNLIKTLSVSIGIIVLLIELCLAYRNYKRSKE